MTAHNLNEVDLVQAECDFLIANTPLFLLRKLKENPITLKIANNTEPDKILTLLNEAILLKPKSLKEAVLPYIYLVALSKNKHSSYLCEAAKLKPLYHDWYEYLATVLLRSYKSATVNTILVETTKFLQTYAD